MLHRRVLPYALTLLLLSPAASFAASATQDAYDEGDSVVQDDTTSGSTDVATLTLKDLSTNQDACKGVTPVLSFSAAQGS